MLGGDLAREVTAARGYVEFSDQEISECPLIYQSRYCAGPLQGREIPHGEKVKMFVLPFTDATALVVDAKDRYLGEVALVKRVLSINPQAFQTEAPYEQRPEIRSSALQQAAGEKHSRIADILEPVRIRHREEVQEARDLREHNRKVISGAPITPEEIHSARVAAGHKGTRTAAATRLQAHGKAQNWDDWQAPASASAFDHLAEDEELPDAL